MSHKENVWGQWGTHIKIYLESFRMLQLSKDGGGLALPNIIFYNWPCHIRTIHEWMHAYVKGKERPIESWACAPFSSTSELKRKQKATWGGLLIKNKIKVWWDFNKYASNSPNQYRLTPLMNNFDFSPGIINVRFHRSYSAGQSCRWCVWR